MNHGTYAAYTHHACRCDACRRANMRAKKSWRIRTRALRGDRAQEPIRVPVDRARGHVAALVASGWTRSEIARETGRSVQALYSLLDRPRGRGPKTIHRDIEAQLLALEPLTPVGTDPVVIDRLIAGDDWKTLNATRAERIAAAERLWHHWRPIRERQHADGTAPQWLDGPSLTDIERRFSLRAGRDFRRTPDEQPTRGAA